MDDNLVAPSRYEEEHLNARTLSRASVSLRSRWVGSFREIGPVTPYCGGVQASSNVLAWHQREKSTHAHIRNKWHNEDCLV
jgi:hypothetical protein